MKRLWSMVCLFAACAVVAPTLLAQDAPLPAGWQGYKYRPEPYRGTWTSAAMPANGWMFDVTKNAAGDSFVFLSYYTYTVAGDPTFWTMFAPLAYSSDEEYRASGVMARAVGNAYTVRGGSVWGGVAQSAISTPVPDGQLSVEWHSPREAVVNQGGTSILIKQSELSTPSWAGDYVAVYRNVRQYTAGNTHFMSGTPIIRLTEMPNDIVYQASPLEQPGTDFHMVKTGSRVYTMKCLGSCSGMLNWSATEPVANTGYLWHVENSGIGWVTSFRNVSTSGGPKTLQLYFVEGQGPVTTSLRTPQIFAQRDELYIRLPQTLGAPWEGYEDAKLIRLPTKYLEAQ